MLPVRYDWIFSRHFVGSVLPSRMLIHADRPRPLTGVPVVVSVTVNLTLTSSAALIEPTFWTRGSAVNSIATPCSTIFCVWGVFLGVGSCADAAVAKRKNPANKLVIFRWARGRMF